MLYGIDISHHQGGGFDLRRTRAEGFDFAFLKATDGAGWVDPQFGRNLGEARGAGLLVAAYHYQRGNASAAAQVDTITRTVPRDVPVLPDVEKDGGNLALTRDIVGRLRGAGYTVPLAYVPRWYWRDTLGSPSLVGLPPLWSSRYPDMNGGYASQIYQRVPANYWDGYGGVGVEVLQFTSSATVAGHTPVDSNAYRGTREQLAALLGTNPAGTPAPPAPPAPPASPAAGTYIVKSGDTLSGIAARFGTTVAALVQANGIADPDRIYAGQVLKLSGGAPSGGRRIQIRPGDTLSGIAKQYGTTVAAIAARNGIANPNKINAGAWLTLP